MTTTGVCARCDFYEQKMREDRRWAPQYYQARFHHRMYERCGRLVPESPLVPAGNENDL